MGPRWGARWLASHELFELHVESHGGAIFETVGDAVYSAFSDAGAAVAAALDAQLALEARLRRGGCSPPGSNVDGRVRHRVGHGRI
jgi:class 3 adenylate cyclase